jgi:hypothetical protein
MKGQPPPLVRQQLASYARQDFTVCRDHQALTEQEPHCQCCSSAGGARAMQDVELLCTVDVTHVLQSVQSRRYACVTECAESTLRMCYRVCPAWLTGDTQSDGDHPCSMLQAN